MTSNSPDHSADHGGAALNARPRVTEIELHGIDTIPAADRTSTPFDLFRIQFGGANTFATVLLGTFSIALGLSFWQAVLATVAGVLVGAVILMPMGLFGPKTGTNNAVSSGAHFGVRGRVVGSFLSLLTAIAFYSISVWVSGDAIVGALTRLAGSRGQRPAPHDHLRRHRRHRHHGRGLRLPVHAAGEQDRRDRQHPALPAGHRRVRDHVRPVVRPGPGRLRARIVLADLRARCAHRHEQSDLVRRVPRRLVAVHPEEHPAAQAHGGHAPRPGRDARAVPVRRRHRHDRRGRGRLRRRAHSGLSALVRGGAHRRRLHRRTLHRIHLALRHRARLLVGLPAIQSGSGDLRHRFARLRLHPRRPPRLRPARRGQRVRWGHHRHHDPVDDHHGHRLLRAPRRLRRASAAGVQPRRDRAACTGSPAASTGGASWHGSPRPVSGCSSPTTRP